jgi:hypothetical protein
MRPVSPYYKHPHAQLMRKARRYVDNWDNMPAKILKSMILELVGALEKQPEELVIAHETITRLNRRCQEAEADLEIVPVPVAWTGEQDPNEGQEADFEGVGGAVESTPDGAGRPEGQDALQHRTTPAPGQAAQVAGGL